MDQPYVRGPGLWSPSTQSCSVNTQCVNCVCWLAPPDVEGHWLSSRSFQITELLTLSRPTRQDTLRRKLIWQRVHSCTLVTLQILWLLPKESEKKTSELKVLLCVSLRCNSRPQSSSRSTWLDQVTTSLKDCWILQYSTGSRPLTTGESQGTPWTGYLSITGQHRHVSQQLT